MQSICVISVIADDDIEAHLCERLLGVLFQVWLMACYRSFFPSPSYWKTLQCLCLRWRHRQIVVEQWKKIQLIMTAKLCRELVDPDCPDVKIGKFVFDNFSAFAPFRMQILSHPNTK